MSKVLVAIRIRPQSEREIANGSREAVEVSGHKLQVRNVKLENQNFKLADSRSWVRSFEFDHIYWSVNPSSPNFATQEMVYNELGREVMTSTFSGYNACLFAYGQTGSGKTYTMMGNENDLGLIPRICQGLFDHIRDRLNEDSKTSCTVNVSYMEIYKEKVCDLLVSSTSAKEPNRQHLRVREHPENGPYVENLSRHLVKDNKSIQSLIAKGNTSRTVAATRVHDKSSRSHAIFTVYFTSVQLSEELPNKIISKINMVDLAGSERADATSNFDKDRMKEGSLINKSLTTLGNVIQALAKRSVLNFWDGSQSAKSDGQTGQQSFSEPPLGGRCRSIFIPYRDSVLTWLLKDSLGGNAKTIMIATISSSDLCYSETVNTLHYAHGAKSIVNRPVVNEDPVARLIRELRDEIARLQALLLSQTVGSGIADSEIALKLEENKKKASELTRTFLDQCNVEQELLEAGDLRIKSLNSTNSGVFLDSRLPHLICMDDDMLNTGIVLYQLKDGETKVGNEAGAPLVDIVLNSEDINSEHCTFRNSNNEVTLEPNEGALIRVNDRPITEPVRLTQGDVIFLGHDHMFRYNNPQEAAAIREKRRSQLGGDGRLPGALSRCSSLSSVNVSGGIEVGSPNDSMLSTQLSRRCSHSEQNWSFEDRERLQQAMEELERLQNECNRAQQELMEKEEALYRTHEANCIEFEAKQRHLEEKERKIEEEHTEAWNEIERRREELEKLRAKYAAQNTEPGEAGDKSELRQLLFLSPPELEEQFSKWKQDIAEEFQMKSKDLDSEKADLKASEEKFRNEAEGRLEDVGRQNQYLVDLENKRMNLVYFIEKADNVFPPKLDSVLPRSASLNDCRLCQHESDILCDFHRSIDNFSVPDSVSKVASGHMMDLRASLTHLNRPLARELQSQRAVESGHLKKMILSRSLHNCNQNPVSNSSKAVRYHTPDGRYKKNSLPLLNQDISRSSSYPSLPQALESSSNVENLPKAGSFSFGKPLQFSSMANLASVPESLNEDFDETPMSNKFSSIEPWSPVVKSVPWNFDYLAIPGKETQKRKENNGTTSNLLTNPPKKADRESHSSLNNAAKTSRAVPKSNKAAKTKNSPPDDHASALPNVSRMQAFEPVSKRLSAPVKKPETTRASAQAIEKNNLVPKEKPAFKSCTSSSPKKDEKQTKLGPSKRAPELTKRFPRAENRNEESISGANEKQLPLSTSKNLINQKDQQTEMQHKIKLPERGKVTKKTTSCESVVSGRKLAGEKQIVGKTREALTSKHEAKTVLTAEAEGSCVTKTLNGTEHADLVQTLSSAQTPEEISHSQLEKTKASEKSNTELLPSAGDEFSDDSLDAQGTPNDVSKFQEQEHSVAISSGEGLNSFNPSKSDVPSSIRNDSHMLQSFSDDSLSDKIGERDSEGKMIILPDSVFPLLSKSPHVSAELIDDPNIPAEDQTVDYSKMKQANDGSYLLLEGADSGENACLHVRKVGKACRRNGRRRAPNRAIINETSSAESDENDLCDVMSDDSLTFGSKPKPHSHGTSSMKRKKRAHLQNGITKVLSNCSSADNDYVSSEDVSNASDEESAVSRKSSIQSIDLKLSSAFKKMSEDESPYKIRVFSSGSSHLQKQTPSSRLLTNSSGALVGPAIQTRNLHLGFSQLECWNNADSLESTATTGNFAISQGQRKPLDFYEESHGLQKEVLRAQKWQHLGFSRMLVCDVALPQYETCTDHAETDPGFMSSSSGIKLDSGESIEASLHEINSNIESIAPRNAALEQALNSQESVLPMTLSNSLPSEDIKEIFSADDGDMKSSVVFNKPGDYLPQGAVEMDQNGNNELPKVLLAGLENEKLSRSDLHSELLLGTMSDVVQSSDDTLTTEGNKFSKWQALGLSRVLVSENAPSVDKNEVSIEKIDSNPSNVIRNSEATLGSEENQFFKWQALGLSRVLVSENVPTLDKDEVSLQKINSNQSDVIQNSEDSFNNDFSRLGVSHVLDSANAPSLDKNEVLIKKIDSSQSNIIQNSEDMLSSRENQFSKWQALGLSRVLISENASTLDKNEVSLQKIDSNQSSIIQNSEDMLSSEENQFSKWQALGLSRVLVSENVPTLDKDDVLLEKIDSNQSYVTANSEDTLNTEESPFSKWKELGLSLVLVSENIPYVDKNEALLMKIDSSPSDVTHDSENTLNTEENKFSKWQALGLSRVLVSENNVALDKDEVLSKMLDLKQKSNETKSTGVVSQSEIGKFLVPDLELPEMGMLDVGCDSETLEKKQIHQQKWRVMGFSRTLVTDDVQLLETDKSLLDLTVSVKSESSVSTESSEKEQLVEGSRGFNAAVNDILKDKVEDVVEKNNLFVGQSSCEVKVAHDAATVSKDSIITLTDEVDTAMDVSLQSLNGAHNDLTISLPSKSEFLKYESEYESTVMPGTEEDLGQYVSAITAKQDGKDGQNQEEEGETGTVLLGVEALVATVGEVDHEEDENLVAQVSDQYFESPVEQRIDKILTESIPEGHLAAALHSKAALASVSRNNDQRSMIDRIRSYVGLYLKRQFVSLGDLANFDVSDVVESSLDYETSRPDTSSYVEERDSPLKQQKSRRWSVGALDYGQFLNNKEPLLKFFHVGPMLGSDGLRSSDIQHFPHTEFSFSKEASKSADNERKDDHSVENVDSVILGEKEYSDLHPLGHEQQSNEADALSTDILKSELVIRDDKAANLSVPYVSNINPCLQVSHEEIASNFDVKDGEFPEKLTGSGYREDGSVFEVHVADDDEKSDVIHSAEEPLQRCIDFSVTVNEELHGMASSINPLLSEPSRHELSMKQTDSVMNSESDELVSTTGVIIDGKFVGTGEVPQLLSNETALKELHSEEIENNPDFRIMKGSMDANVVLDSGVYVNSCDSSLNVDEKIGCLIAEDGKTGTEILDDLCLGKYNDLALPRSTHESMNVSYSTTIVDGVLIMNLSDSQKEVSVVQELSKSSLSSELHKDRPSSDFYDGKSKENVHRSEVQNMTSNVNPTEGKVFALSGHLGDTCTNKPAQDALSDLDSGFSASENYATDSATDNEVLSPIHWASRENSFREANRHCPKQAVTTANGKESANLVSRPIEESLRGSHMNAHSVSSEHSSELLSSEDRISSDANTTDTSNSENGLPQAGDLGLNLQSWQNVEATNFNIESSELLNKNMTIDIIYSEESDSNVAKSSKEPCFNDSTSNLPAQDFGFNNAVRTYVENIVANAVLQLKDDECFPTVCNEGEIMVNAVLKNKVKNDEDVDETDTNMSSDNQNSLTKNDESIISTSLENNLYGTESKCGNFSNSQDMDNEETSNMEISAMEQNPKVNNANDIVAMDTKPQVNVDSLSIECSDFANDSEVSNTSDHHETNYENNLYMETKEALACSLSTDKYNDASVNMSELGDILLSDVYLSSVIDPLTAVGITESKDHLVSIVATNIYSEYLTLREVPKADLKELANDSTSSDDAHSFNTENPQSDYSVSESDKSMMSSTLQSGTLKEDIQSGIKFHNGLKTDVVDPMCDRMLGDEVEQKFVEVGEDNGISKSVEGSEAAHNGTESVEGNEAAHNGMESVKGSEAAQNVTESIEGSEAAQNVTESVKGSEAAQNVTESIEDIEAAQNGMDSVKGSEAAQNVTWSAKGSEAAQNGTESFEGSEAAQNGMDSFKGSKATQNVTGSAEGSEAAQNGTESVEDSEAVQNGTETFEGSEAAQSGASKSTYTREKSDNIMVIKHCEMFEERLIADRLRFYNSQLEEVTQLGENIVEPPVEGKLNSNGGGKDSVVEDELAGETKETLAGAGVLRITSQTEEDANTEKVSKQMDGHVPNDHMSQSHSQVGNGSESSKIKNDKALEKSSVLVGSTSETIKVDLLDYNKECFGLKMTDELVMDKISSETSPFAKDKAESALVVENGDVEQKVVEAMDGKESQEDLNQGSECMDPGEPQVNREDAGIYENLLGLNTLLLEDDKKSHSISDCSSDYVPGLNGSISHALPWFSSIDKSDSDLISDESEETQLTEGVKESKRHLSADSKFTDNAEKRKSDEKINSEADDTTSCEALQVESQMAGSSFNIDKLQSRESAEKYENKLIDLHDLDNADFDESIYANSRGLKTLKELEGMVKLDSINKFATVISGPRKDLAETEKGEFASLLHGNGSVECIESKEHTANDDSRLENDILVINETSEEIVGAELVVLEYLSLVPGAGEASEKLSDSETAAFYDEILSHLGNDMKERNAQKEHEHTDIKRIGNKETFGPTSDSEVKNCVRPSTEIIDTQQLENVVKLIENNYKASENGQEKGIEMQVDTSELRNKGTFAKKAETIDSNENEGTGGKVHTADDCNMMYNTKGNNEENIEDMKADSREPDYKINISLGSGEAHNEEIAFITDKGKDCVKTVVKGVDVVRAGEDGILSSAIVIPDTKQTSQKKTDTEKWSGRVGEKSDNDGRKSEENKLIDETKLSAGENEIFEQKADAVKVKNKGLDVNQGGDREFSESGKREQQTKIGDADAIRSSDQKPKVPNSGLGENNSSDSNGKLRGTKIDGSNFGLTGNPRTVGKELGTTDAGEYEAAVEAGEKGMAVMESDVLRTDTSGTGQREIEGYESIKPETKFKNDSYVKAKNDESIYIGLNNEGNMGLDNDSETKMCSTSSVERVHAIESDITDAEKTEIPSKIVTEDVNDRPEAEKDDKKVDIKKPYIGETTEFTKFYQKDSSAAACDTKKANTEETGVSEIGTINGSSEFLINEEVPAHTEMSPKGSLVENAESSKVSVDHDWQRRVIKLDEYQSPVKVSAADMDVSAITADVSDSDLSESDLSELTISFASIPFERPSSIDSFYAGDHQLQTSLKYMNNSNKELNCFQPEISVTPCQGDDPKQKAGHGSVHLFSPTESMSQSIMAYSTGSVAENKATPNVMSENEANEQKLQYNASSNDLVNASSISESYSLRSDFIIKPGLHEAQSMKHTYKDTEVLGLDILPPQPESPGNLGKSLKKTEVEIITGGHSRIGFPIEAPAEVDFQFIGLQPISKEPVEFFRECEAVLQEELSSPYQHDFMRLALNIEIRPHSSDLYSDPYLASNSKSGETTFGVSVVDSRDDLIPQETEKPETINEHREAFENLDSWSSERNVISTRNFSVPGSTVVNERQSFTVNSFSDEPGLLRQCYRTDAGVFVHSADFRLSVPNSSSGSQVLTPQTVDSGIWERTASELKLSQMYQPSLISASTTLSESDEELLGSESGLYEGIVPSFKALPCTIASDNLGIEKSKFVEGEPTTDRCKLQKFADHFPLLEFSHGKNLPKSDKRRCRSLSLQRVRSESLGSLASIFLPQNHPGDEEHGRIHRKHHKDTNSLTFTRTASASEIFKLSGSFRAKHLQRSTSLDVFENLFVEDIAPEDIFGRASFKHSDVLYRRFRSPNQSGTSTVRMSAVFFENSPVEEGSSDASKLEADTLFDLQGHVGNDLDDFRCIILKENKNADVAAGGPQSQHLEAHEVGAAEISDKHVANFEAVGCSQLQHNQQCNRALANSDVNECDHTDGAHSSYNPVESFEALLPKTGAKHKMSPAKTGLGCTDVSHSENSVKQISASELPYHLRAIETQTYPEMRGIETQTYNWLEPGQKRMETHMLVGDGPDMVSVIDDSPREEELPLAAGDSAHQRKKSQDSVYSRLVEPSLQKHFKEEDLATDFRATGIDTDRLIPIGSTKAQESGSLEKTKPYTELSDTYDSNCHADNHSDHLLTRNLPADCRHSEKSATERQSVIQHVSNVMPVGSSLERHLQRHVPAVMSSTEEPSALDTIRMLEYPHYSSFKHSQLVSDHRRNSWTPGSAHKSDLSLFSAAEHTQSTISAESLSDIDGSKRSNPRVVEKNLRDVAMKLNFNEPPSYFDLSPEKKSKSERNMTDSCHTTPSFYRDGSDRTAKFSSRNDRGIFDQSTRFNQSSVQHEVLDNLDFDLGRNRRHCSSHLCDSGQWNHLQTSGTRGHLSSGAQDSGVEDFRFGSPGNSINFDFPVFSSSRFQFREAAAAGQGSSTMELERLREERRRIVEMLSRDVVPSKVQVELAEAQLHYLIGQADLLLQTIDEHEDLDQRKVMDAMKSPDEQLTDMGQCYLNEFRLKLEHARLRIEKQIQTIEMEQAVSHLRLSEQIQYDNNIKQMRYKPERADITDLPQFQDRERDRTQSTSSYQRLCKTCASNSQDVEGLSPSQMQQYLTSIRREVVAATRWYDTTPPGRRSKLPYFSGRSSTKPLMNHQKQHASFSNLRSHMRENQTQNKCRNLNFGGRCQSTFDDESSLLLDECQQLRLSAQNEISQAMKALNDTRAVRKKQSYSSYGSDPYLQSKVKDLPNERSIGRKKTSISHSIPPDSGIYHQNGAPSTSSLPRSFEHGSTGDLFDSNVNITRNPLEDKTRRRSSVGNYSSGRSFAGLSGEHSFRSESTLASDLSWRHSSPKTDSALQHRQSSSVIRHDNRNSAMTGRLQITTPVSPVFFNPREIDTLTKKRTVCGSLLTDPGTSARR